MAEGKRGRERVDSRAGCCCEMKWLVYREGEFYDFPETVFCCVALPTSSSPSPNAKMTLNIHSHFRSAKNEQKIHKYYNVKNDEKDTTQQQTAEKFPTNEINFGISGLAWSNLSEFSELRCPKMIVKENSNFIDFHRRCWDDVALYLRVLRERCSVN